MRLHRDFSAVNRVERRVRFVAEAAAIGVHAEIRVTREVRKREPIITHLLRDLAHFLLAERFPEILCDILTAFSGTGLPRHLDTVTRVLGHFTHRVGDTDVAFKHVLIAAEAAGSNHNSLCRHLAGLPILANNPDAGHIALCVLNEFSGPGREKRLAASLQERVLQGDESLRAAILIAMERCGHSNVSVRAASTGVDQASSGSRSRSASQPFFRIHQ